MIKLSVIIPVLNEAANLPATLAAAQAATAPIEIIVVNGNSQDDSALIAQQSGAKVIDAVPGRASQMNAGAAIAQGEALLFLHGDTILPTHYDIYIDKLLAQPEVIAGAFNLKIAGTEAGLRLVEWGVKWRSRWLQLPYGDQGIFLRADTFQQVGGFPGLPIMEDFVLVQRLQHIGRVAIAPASVLTSSRRWRQFGICKTTLLNQCILVGYFLGVSPMHLAQWYRQVRSHGDRHQGSSIK